MPDRSETRQRIVTAAATLLTEQGRDAVTTRSVSAAAGVQPPTIYRLFGDMRGLLDAVAADGFERYLARKAAQAPSGDPVDDLRAGWDLHVAFGLENPAHYQLMYAGQTPGSAGKAVAQAHGILLGLVGAVAAAGRLAMPVERAAAMIHAAGMGVTLSLIGTAPADRDPRLSALTREAVIAAVTDADDDRAPDDGEPARRAVALGAVLDASPVRLSTGERALLDELLERLAGA
ncbi:TetR/AcrR family transcriptional regulator [Jiangella asiatica]|uniref:TetR/AcrR family transcriptional regulator n=1 Tax=Jiangella asiatica TaxID=2530372 RepID=A0A4R5CP11_9ACTN|nr:TetR/AcrR family transcriptional regulator [Jiangella asiatica]TDE01040.1 TetR/AcrR family transcriptional regulator [Jiangella asiatica]